MPDKMKVWRELLLPKYKAKEVPAQFVAAISSSFSGVELGTFRHYTTTGKLSDPFVFEMPLILSQPIIRKVILLLLLAYLQQRRV